MMAMAETLHWLTANPVSSAAVFLVGVILAGCIYRLYIHPLSVIPGPRIAACTSLWLAYHTYVGDESSAVFDLHKKYGRVLRVAPNDVDIDDGDAVEPVYIARGGFPKTAAYSKFDIDGHTTIFSTLTLPDRANRAKAVAPLFSTASIRNAHSTIGRVFDDFVERLRTEARTGKPVDVLNISRSMAIDVVSTYLFQQRYGAISEQSEAMSASPFVDSYVGVGAYFNLMMGKIGDLVMTIVEWCIANAKTEAAFGIMDRYSAQLVKGAVPKSGSYQSRLLEKVSIEQSQIEVKDVCFAGTDSTGMNMASILWYLAKTPDAYVTSAFFYCFWDIEPANTKQLCLSAG